MFSWIRHCMAAVCTLLSVLLVFYLDCCMLTERGTGPSIFQTSEAWFLSVLPWTNPRKDFIRGLNVTSSAHLLGKERWRLLKILLRDQNFIGIFASLGTSWNITNDLFCIIQGFVCQLHCRNTKVTKINELRHQMFRSTLGEHKSAQLPPCEDTLLQHTRRSNDQAGGHMATEFRQFARYSQP